MEGSTDGRPLDVHALRELLKSDPPRWTAYRDLASLADIAALQILVDECASRDPYRRRAAVEALGRSPLGRQAAAVVRRLIDDASPYVARSALAASAALRDDDAHEAVLRALTATEPATRIAALNATDALWREPDSAIVVAIASTDPDRNVRKEANWVLWNHVPVPAHPQIARWAASDVPRERIWAAELMERSPEHRDRSTIEKLLRDLDGHVRQAAQRALTATYASQGPMHAIAVARVDADRAVRTETPTRQGGPSVTEVIFLEDDGDAWLLLEYTLSGEFVGDNWYERLDDAKDEARQLFGVGAADWVDVPEHVAPLEFARRRFSSVT